VRVDTGSVITDTLGGVTVVSYVYTAAAGCTESKAERADNGKPAPSKTYTLPSLSANVHPFLASPDNTPSSPGGGRNPPDPVDRYACAAPSPSVSTTDPDADADAFEYPPPPPGNANVHPAGSTDNPGVNHVEGNRCALLLGSLTYNAILPGPPWL